MALISADHRLWMPGNIRRDTVFVKKRFVLY